MRCYGQDTGCCTCQNQCDNGDGDCDTNGECGKNLDCGSSNCDTSKSANKIGNDGVRKFHVLIFFLLGGEASD